MTRIYGLYDQTGEVRYVGKTNISFTRRLNEHWLCRLKKLTHKDKWLSSLSEKPIIVEIEVVPDGESWQEAEQFWIGCFRDLGYRLTNGTDGGDGRSKFKTTEETKRKISESLRGKQKPPRSVSHCV